MASIENRQLEQRLQLLLAQVNAATNPAGIVQMLQGKGGIELEDGEQINGQLFHDIGGAKAEVYPLTNGYVIYRDPGDGLYHSADIVTFGEMISPHGVIGSNVEWARAYQPKLGDALADFIGAYDGPMSASLSAEINELTAEVEEVFARAAPGWTVKIGRQLYGEGNGIVESGAMGSDRQQTAGLFFRSAQMAMISADLTRADPLVTAYYEIHRVLDPLFTDAEKSTMKDVLPAFEKAVAQLHRQDIEKQLDTERAAFKAMSSDDPAYNRQKQSLESLRKFLTEAKAAERNAGKGTQNQSKRIREMFGIAAAAMHRDPRELQEIIKRAKKIHKEGLAPSRHAPDKSDKKLPPALALKDRIVEGLYERAETVFDKFKRFLSMLGIAHKKTGWKTFEQVVSASIDGSVYNRSQVFDTAESLNRLEAANIAKLAGLDRLSLQIGKIAARVRDRDVPAKDLIEAMRKQLPDDRIREAIYQAGFHAIIDGAEIGINADQLRKARKIAAHVTSATPMKTGNVAAGAPAALGNRPLGSAPPVTHNPPEIRKPQRQGLLYTFWTPEEFLVGAQNGVLPIRQTMKQSSNGTVYRDAQGRPQVQGLQWLSPETGQPLFEVSLESVKGDERAAVLEIHGRLLQNAIQRGEPFSHQVAASIGLQAPRNIHEDAGQARAPHPLQDQDDKPWKTAAARMGTRPLPRSDFQAVEAGSGGWTADETERFAMAMPMRAMAGAAFTVQGDASGYALHAVMPNEAVAALGSWRSPIDAVAAARAVDSEAIHPHHALRESLDQARAGYSAPPTTPRGLENRQPLEPLEIDGGPLYAIRPRPDWLNGGYDVYEADGSGYVSIGPAATREAALQHIRERRSRIDSLADSLARQTPSFSVDDIAGRAVDYWDKIKRDLALGSVGGDLDTAARDEALRQASAEIRGVKPVTRRLHVNIGQQSRDPDLAAGRIETAVGSPPLYDRVNEQNELVLTWGVTDALAAAQLIERLSNEPAARHVTFEEMRDQRSLRIPVIEENRLDTKAVDDLQAGVDPRAWSVGVTFLADKSTGIDPLAALVGRLPARFEYGIGGDRHGKAAISRALFLADSEHEADLLRQHLEVAVAKGSKSLARRAALSQEEVARLLRVDAPRQEDTISRAEARRLVTSDHVLFSVSPVVEAAAPDAALFEKAREDSYERLAAHQAQQRHYLTAEPGRWEQAIADGAVFDINMQAPFVLSSHPRLKEMLATYGDYEDVRRRREYLHVPKEQIDDARRLKAGYDPLAREFFIPERLSGMEKAALRMRYMTEGNRQALQQEQMAEQARMMDQSRQAIGYAQAVGAPYFVPRTPAPQAPDVGHDGGRTRPPGTRSSTDHSFASADREASAAGAPPAPYIASFPRDNQAEMETDDARIKPARIPESPRIAEGSTIIDSLMRATEGVAGNALVGLGQGWMKNSLQQQEERNRALSELAGQRSYAVEQNAPPPEAISSAPAPAHDQATQATHASPQASPDPLPSTRPLMPDSRTRQDASTMTLIAERLHQAPDSALQHLYAENRKALEASARLTRENGHTNRRIEESLALQAGINLLLAEMKSRGIKPLEDRASAMTAAQKRPARDQNER